MSELIIQFAKWPEAGKVKTRLAKHIGDAAALAVHCQLLRQVWAQLKDYDQADFELWWDQQLVDSQLQTFLHEHPDLVAEQTQYQRGSGLGERMLYALESGLEQYDKVIIVGSDCPSVTPSYVQQAFDSLQSADLVLGPAEDGGYVLIGAHRRCKNRLSSILMAEIPWGMAQVLAKTCAAAQRQDLAVSLLDMAWDVDELADYQRWLCEFGPQTGEKA